jgi:hypothetical protein
MSNLIKLRTTEIELLPPGTSVKHNANFSYEFHGFYLSQQIG